MKTLFNRLKWPLAGALVTGAALVSRLANAAVQPEPGMGLPRDVSLDGWRIDWLMNVTHVFNIILFVIMCVWMLYASLKHNKNHEAEYDHGNSKRSVTVALCLSAFIFAVVDGNLFFSTMKGLDEAFWNWDLPRKNEKTVRIEINAHQWAWDFRYAGDDKKFATPKVDSGDDIVTWNDFKIPVNTPVHLQLASTDVIHSFFLPNFRVKIDAVPGQINQMWFQATQTGEFEVGCAQHCGTHHYKMKAKVTVLSEEDYRKWTAEASTNGMRSYDAEDVSARWGWDWKEY